MLFLPFLFERLIMKMILNIIAVTLSLVCSSITFAYNEPKQCKVVGVTDGDTITCLTNNKQQLKVRLYGIDAPEKKQDFGEKSKQNLSKLIYNQDVILDIKQTDRYGRIVADILFKTNNANLNSANLMQVQQGFAWAYSSFIKNNKEQEIYLNAQKQAQQNKLGLWSHPNPIEPSKFRKFQQNNLIL